MTTDRDDLLARLDNAAGEGYDHPPSVSELVLLCASAAAEVRRLRAELDRARPVLDADKPMRSMDEVRRRYMPGSQLPHAFDRADPRCRRCDRPFDAAIHNEFMAAVRAYREQTGSTPPPATTDSSEQSRQMIEDVTAEHARTWQTPSNGLVSHPPLAADSPAACQTCDGTRKVQPFPLMGDHTATQIACPDCQPTVTEGQP